MVIGMTVAGNMNRNRFRYCSKDLIIMKMSFGIGHTVGYYLNIKCMDCYY
jgi:hypothetical protein